MTESTGEHAMQEQGEKKAVDVIGRDGVGLDGKKEGAGLAFRKYQHFDKEKAIELYITYPKNVSLICKSLGVNRGTWQYNLDHDPDFSSAIHEIEEAHCDDLEATMLDLGKQKSSFNFNDRIAYLRAHRPHLYNPTRKIIVESHQMDGGEKAKRLGAVDRAIDAEIVKTYEDRKERNQVKQQQRQERLEAGEERTGGGGG